MNRLTVPEVRKLSLLLLPSIFGRCLADEDRKYSTSAPFLWQDRVVATDGRILVLMPASPAVAEILSHCPDRKLVDPAPVLKDAQRLYLVEPTPLPLPLQGETTCVVCSGRGTGFCDDCEMSTQCNYCDGRGLMLEPSHRVWLAPDVPISLHYAWALHFERASLFLPVERPGKPIRFTVGPVEGLLMPMAYPEPHA